MKSGVCHLMSEGLQFPRMFFDMGVSASAFVPALAPALVLALAPVVVALPTMAALLLAAAVAAPNVE